MDKLAINHYNEATDFPSDKSSDQVTTITYEFTNDYLLLEKYYKIREECYRKDLGLENFAGDEDEYDKNGHILIVREGNLVMGGARLVTSTFGNRLPLPLEDPSFTIENIFPSFNNIGYCEFSRLAIAPEFRKKVSITQLVMSLITKANNSGCMYAFAISPAIQARHYELIFKKLHYPYKIIKNIILPYKPLYYHLNNNGINLSIGGLEPNIQLNDIEFNNILTKEKGYIT